jgi:hypothetical protein
MPDSPGDMNTGDDRTPDFAIILPDPSKSNQCALKKGPGEDYCDGPIIRLLTCTSIGRHSLMIFLILTATQFPGNNPDRTIIFEIPCTVLTTTGEINDHPLVIDHCPEFYRAAFLG